MPATRRRPEQARTQPGRELDPCRGPHPGGEADDLSEPVWLWPQHTMRTKREGMAGRRAFGSPSSNERNGEVRCVQSQPRQPTTAQQAVLSRLWLATTKPRGPQGSPYGRP